MDLPFLVLVLTLVAFGLVMLCSASSAVALYRRQDAFAYVRPQLLYAAMGLVAMWTASRVDYHIYHKLAWPLLALSLVLLTAVLELACVPALGRVHGYTEAFPTGQFVYLFVCTVAVDLMLFFGELLLMLWCGNPLPALCVGIVGALVGLFSAFLPPLVSYFVPFGYYIPLSAYEVANWDQASHLVTYGTRAHNWGLLAFTILLGIGLFAAAWRKVQTEEV